jgi:phage I-like protein
MEYDTAMQDYQVIAPDVEADDVSEWVHLIPAGTFWGRDGRGPYRLDVQAVLDAFRAHGADLPVDYEHQSLSAGDKAGPVPAAGWIQDLEARDDGLWARVSWTPTARQLLAAKEYRYLSPVFRHDKQGRVVALEGAGLTHMPNLYLRAAARQEDPMDLTPLAEALGIDPSADIETIAAHAKQLREAATREPDPTQWVPMSQHKAVADELARLQAEIAKGKAESAVREAMSQGKLSPAMRDWALSYAVKDPDGFAEWVKAAPVVVTADTTVSANAAQKPDMLSDEDRYVCAALGISESDFAAHKRAVVKE